VNHRDAYQLVELLYAVRTRCQQQRLAINDRLQAALGSLAAEPGEVADQLRAAMDFVRQTYDYVESDLEQAIGIARAAEAQADVRPSNQYSESSHDTR
jgi:hypothetical protein